MAHIYGAILAALAAGAVPGLAVALALGDGGLGLKTAIIAAALMFAVARPRSARLA